MTITNTTSSTFEDNSWPAPPPAAVGSINTIAGLEHLALDTAAQPRASKQGTAVLYLRVSTVRQLNTGADVDADGNSIATQRQWARDAACELGATVVEEFVDPGHSAQSIEKRPEFKRMMRYIDEHPDVRYVVIYMRSRVFRNHLDAAVTKIRLREKNVTLVSAKEKFGDDYMGDAMEAITDIMNEVQVRQSGEDIKVKMAHKVQRGGSVGRAKLGYLNVRKEFDGRLVNTIDLDPDRYPILQWAFAQYATDQYSIWQLCGLLEEQGLTTRPSSKRPARPLSPSALAKILRDPYYAGTIRYKGALYAGRHQAIIDKTTFLTVQKILDRRNRKGDRDITHFHYLKGLLACGQCESEGRTSRLVYSQNVGNGGTYEYYLCAAKQRGNCTIGTMRLDDIETAVARAVAAERFHTESVDTIRREVTRAMETLQAADRELKDSLRKQLTTLETQEDRLIDLAADGTMPSDKLRGRLNDITLQKASIKERLVKTETHLRSGAERVLAYVDLLENPGDLYVSLAGNTRRDLLAAFFQRLIVYVEDDGLHIRPIRTDVNEALHDWQTNTHAANERASRVSAEGSPFSTTQRDSSSNGLSNSQLVGMTGFEPATP
ncbi:recombinase family protein [Microbacterium sp. T32]|uniref:recombinase family protein n=1 Tax=Microbacterium sp. T32 TaxID=1776083 RepID=UPI0009ED9825|nr:recombinase family protein [Microbacterium sp. T32]